MHSGTKDRYVSNHEGMHQRKSGAPSRPSTFNSIPIRNAASSSKSYNGSRKPSRSSSSNNTPAELDTSLPKNFPKPLTCHFWHQNGRCSKRDVDCAYAHYDTGFISSASVTPLIADTTTTGNAARSTETMRATFSKAAASANDVPPNFITIGIRHRLHGSELIRGTLLFERLNFG